MSIELRIDEVHSMIYHYLLETGYIHTAFSFKSEAKIEPNLLRFPPGALLTFLQKSLLYIWIEQHIDRDGEEKPCVAPFSLSAVHECVAPAAPPSSARSPLQWSEDGTKRNHDSTAAAKPKGRRRGSGDQGENSPNADHAPADGKQLPIRRATGSRVSGGQSRPAVVSAAKRRKGFAPTNPREEEDSLANEPDTTPMDTDDGCTVLPDAVAKSSRILEISDECGVVSLSSDRWLVHTAEGSEGSPSELVRLYQCSASKVSDGVDPEAETAQKVCELRYETTLGSPLDGLCERLAEDKVAIIHDRGAVVVTFKEESLELTKEVELGFPNTAWEFSGCKFYPSDGEAITRPLLIMYGALVAIWDTTALMNMTTIRFSESEQGGIVATEVDAEKDPVDAPCLEVLAVHLWTDETLLILTETSTKLVVILVKFHEGHVHSMDDFELPCGPMKAQQLCRFPGAVVQAPPWHTPEGNSLWTWTCINEKPGKTKLAIYNLCNGTTGAILLMTMSDPQPRWISALPSAAREIFWLPRTEELPLTRLACICSSWTTEPPTGDFAIVAVDETEGGDAFHVLYATDTCLASAAPSPDGKYFAMLAESQATVLDCHTYKPLVTIKGMRYGPPRWSVDSRSVSNNVLCDRDDEHSKSEGDHEGSKAPSRFLEVLRVIA